MGGSGGGFDPGILRSSIREIENSVEDASYESEVAQVLGDVLAYANDRDVESIQSHLASVQGALEKETDGVVDLLFGGSVSKNTFVDGLSDVDALVILNDSELATKSPEEVRTYFVDRLSTRFPDAEVIADGFAVTVCFKNVDLQLVPVKRAGESFLLPSDDLKSWSRTRPREFTESLTTTNRENAGKVVPTIKLAKVLLSGQPENRRPTGYHLESLAVEAFKDYSGTKSPKEMLSHFFRESAQRVLSPLADATGQSRHVDDDLGKKESLERRVLSNTLGRFARRIENADGAKSTEHWRRMFNVKE